MFANMFESFKAFFPSLAESTVEYYNHSRSELVAKLDDGRAFLYDNTNNSIRKLPRDSNNMSEEEYRIEFSMRLKKIMYRKGWTQDDLSEATGITQAMISRYISRKATPSFYNVDKIAKALGCSTDEFRYFG